MPVQKFVIENWNRDGTWRSGTFTGLQTFDSSGSFVQIRRQISPTPSEVIFTSSYFVFDGLNPSLNINKANLSLYGISSIVSNDILVFRIYGIKESNPEIPINISGVAFHPRTSNSVLWTIPKTEGVSGTVSVSPDIKFILDELKSQFNFSSSSLFILCVEFVSIVTGAFLFNNRLYGSYESGLPATLQVYTSDEGSVVIWDTKYDEITDDNENSIDSILLSDTIVDEVTIVEE